jgi:predicted aspartyl protease/Flp pilus assembly protein TadD
VKPLSLRSGSLAVALLACLLVAPGLRAGSQAADEVRLQLADLLLREERYPEAIEVFEGLRASSTSRARWQATFGLVRALLQTGEFKRARTEAADLAAAQPTSGGALALYGDALWVAGLFEEAEAQYRVAATLAPAEARARAGLARALAARNLLDDALTEGRAAVALDGRQAEYHHTLGYILERLRRYDEAAASLRNYLNLLPSKDRSQRALWTTQQVRFLESFGQAVPLKVEPAREVATHTMPFRLVRDKIVVRGKVNGRAMDLVMDTGSELTVVSQVTAQRLGIAPVVYTLTAGVGEVGLRGLQLGRMDSLEIGTLKVQNVPTLIKNPPLRDLPTQEVESFSPLALGFSVQIDYQRRWLTISKTLPPEEYEVELPMRHHRLALVRGRVNGDTPVHFVIDTGGEVISVSRSTAESLQVEVPRRIPLKVYGTSGWDPDAHLLPGVDLAFDSIRMNRQPVVVLNLDAPSVLLGFDVGGIIGHRFLSRYSVGIDLKRSVLGLRRNS